MPPSAWTQMDARSLLYCTYPVMGPKASKMGRAARARPCPSSLGHIHSPQRRSLTLATWTPTARRPWATETPFLSSQALLLPAFSLEVVLCLPVNQSHLFLCLKSLHGVLCTRRLGLSATCSFIFSSFRKRRGADIHSSNKYSGARPM